MERTGAGQNQGGIDTERIVVPRTASAELANATDQYVQLLNAWSDQSVFLDVLLARDRVDRLLQAESIDSATVLELSEPDARLKKQFEQLDDKTLDQIEKWRSSLKAPNDRWWWWPADKGSKSALLPLFAGFCIALTFAIIADVARKILIGSGDTVALFAIFVQVALTVMATSTYSEAGGNALDNLLNQFHLSRNMRAVSKPALALLVLLIAIVTSQQLPRLGDYYYQRAIREFKSHNDLSAQQHLALAGSINPDDPAVHYDTAQLKEDLADFDGAIAEYRLAIRLDPKFYPARLDLANLLLANKADAASALAILEKAMDPVEGDDKYKDLRYSLHKNLGWAYLILKSNNLAREELVSASHEQPNMPAPYCLLAKIDLAEGDKTSANTDFLSCVGNAKQALGNAEAGWIVEARTFTGKKW
jgi:tetratricopeptide (TPR) repeat protein